MTVKKMIELLGRCDPHARVFMSAGDVFGNPVHLMSMVDFKAGHLDTPDEYGPLPEDGVVLDVTVLRKQVVLD